MNATLGDLPSGEEWSFEVKWDGMRIMANTAGQGKTFGNGGPVVLRARSGRDVTTHFPELESLNDRVGVAACFDGEVVALVDGRPSFGQLAHRIHQSSPSSDLLAKIPVVYVVFDLLTLDGNSLAELPYDDRRRILSSLMEGDNRRDVRLTPAVSGDGRAMLEFIKREGMEGLVAKRRAAAYQPGDRSRDWIKVKVRLGQEFVVCGWLPGQGQLSGQIGSLVIGVNDGGAMTCVGSVGSGLTNEHRRQFGELLTVTASCPIDPPPDLDRPAVWVVPNTVVEVRFGSWPTSGNLRHPVFAGVRPDHCPSKVVREVSS